MVGKNILIVDDEAPIREMIAVALEMAGYECLEAENTQQAHAVIVDRKTGAQAAVEAAGFEWRSIIDLDDLGLEAQ